MTDTITIWLDVPLSNNNAGQTRHWSAAYEAKAEFELALAAWCRWKAPTPPDHQQRIVVTRILGKGERLWDADSVLRGTAKQLIDALADAGFFHDDGPKWITEAVGRQDATQRQRGPAVQIEIMRIADCGSRIAD